MLAVLKTLKRDSVSADAGTAAASLQAKARDAAKVVHAQLEQGLHERATRAVKSGLGRMRDAREDVEGSVRASVQRALRGVESSMDGVGKTLSCSINKTTREINSQFSELVGVGETIVATIEKEVDGVVCNMEDTLRNASELLTNFVGGTADRLKQSVQSFASSIPARASRLFSSSTRSRPRRHNDSDRGSDSSDGDGDDGRREGDGGSSTAPANGTTSKRASRRHRARRDRSGFGDAIREEKEEEEEEEKEHVGEKSSGAVGAGPMRRRTTTRSASDSNSDSGRASRRKRSGDSGVGQRSWRQWRGVRRSRTSKVAPLGVDGELLDSGDQGDDKPATNERTEVIPLMPTPP